MRTDARSHALLGCEFTRGRALSTVRAAREPVVAMRDAPFVDAYAEAAPLGRPGLVLSVQNFGDLSNFNPHLDALAGDGVFGAGGRFTALPQVPEALLCEGQHFSRKAAPGNDI